MDSETLYPLLAFILNSKYLLLVIASASEGTFQPEAEKAFAKPVAVNPLPRVMEEPFKFSFTVVALKDGSEPAADVKFQASI